MPRTTWILLLATACAELPPETLETVRRIGPEIRSAEAHVIRPWGDTPYWRLTAEVEPGTADVDHVVFDFYDLALEGRPIQRIELFPEFGDHFAHD